MVIATSLLAPWSAQYSLALCSQREGAGSIDYGTTERSSRITLTSTKSLIGGSWFIRRDDESAHLLKRLKLEPLSGGGTLPNSGLKLSPWDDPRERRQRSTGDANPQPIRRQNRAPG
ncbi:hypothetical protein OPQ81_007269 [Rhizoctonia solani]|nr:hypothetical protein OPQ81_007269 [Rhizoctonia solani]